MKRRVSVALREARLVRAESGAGISNSTGLKFHVPSVFSATSLYISRVVFSFPTFKLAYRVLSVEMLHI